MAADFKEEVGESETNGLVNGRFDLKARYRIKEKILMKSSLDSAAAAIANYVNSHSPGYSPGCLARCGFEALSWLSEGKN